MGNNNIHIDIGLYDFCKIMEWVVTDMKRNLEVPTAYKLIDRIISHRKVCKEWQNGTFDCFNCHHGLLTKLEKELEDAMS